MIGLPFQRFSPMPEQFYLLEEDQQVGPFSADDIKAKVEQQELTSSSFVWHEGLPEWKPLSELFPEIQFPENQSIQATSQTNLPPPLPPTLPTLTPPPLPQKRKWYDLNRVIFGSILVSPLFFFLPIGIIPLWKTKRFSKSIKIALSVAFCFPLFLLLKGSESTVTDNNSSISLSSDHNLSSSEIARNNRLASVKKAVTKVANRELSGEIDFLDITDRQPHQDGYSVIIVYRSVSNWGGFEVDFKRISIAMDSAYKALLKKPELKIVHLKITAQLELQDKYGNKDWISVYRTQVQEDQIRKLNIKNIDNIDFSKLWEVTYTHSVFWPYK